MRITRTLVKYAKMRQCVKYDGTLCLHYTSCHIVAAKVTIAVACWYARQCCCDATAALTLGLHL